MVAWFNSALWAISSMVVESLHIVKKKVRKKYGSYIEFLSKLQARVTLNPSLTNKGGLG